MPSPSFFPAVPKQRKMISWASVLVLHHRPFFSACRPSRFFFLVEKIHNLCSYSHNGERTDMLSKALTDLQLVAWICHLTSAVHGSDSRQCLCWLKPSSENALQPEISKSVPVQALVSAWHSHLCFSSAEVSQIFNSFWIQKRNKPY